MAIFSRRRTQRMLDDISVHLNGSKRADLVARLNNKRFDQAIPAEMELALTCTLSSFPGFEIEPDWCVPGKYPDVHVAELIRGKPAVFEITASTESSVSAENQMDNCSQKIISYANTIKNKSGSYLYFYFAETKLEGNSRQVAAPIDYSLSDKTKAKISNWLTTPNLRDDQLEIKDGDLDVRIEFKEHKQTRFYNFWTSRPPRTYSETNNPIYRLLKSKLDQIENAPPDMLRMIFLANAGSRFLSDIAKSYHGYDVERHVTARNVIQRFIHDQKDKVDTIVVFTPVKEFPKFPANEGKRYWDIQIFSNVEVEALTDVVQGLADKLPTPRFDGEQAKSLFRQSVFKPDQMGWYKGASLTMGDSKNTYRISSRAFQDFMAGRITEKQFRHFIGDSDGKNHFATFLNRGYAVDEIRIESGGIDEDDDTLVFEFSFDPSVREFE